MTCIPIAASAGPCSSCGAYTDGLHVVGDPPTALLCAACCPADHGSIVTPEVRLALQVAVDILHTLGLAPAKFNASKALKLCRAHGDKLPDELRRLIP